MPPFTRREVAVQVRESSAGYNFDALLDTATCERISQRVQADRDTARHNAQNVLDRVRFYDSVGGLVHEWVNPNMPVLSTPGGH
jgi:hypothetical protein